VAKTKNICLFSTQKKCINILWGESDVFEKKNPMSKMNRTFQSDLFRDPPVKNVAREVIAGAIY